MQQSLAGHGNLIDRDHVIHGGSLPLDPSKFAPSCVVYPCKVILFRRFIWKSDDVSLLSPDFFKRFGRVLVVWKCFGNFLHRWKVFSVGNHKLRTRYLSIIHRKAAFHPFTKWQATILRKIWCWRLMSPTPHLWAVLSTSPWRTAFSR